MKLATNNKGSDAEEALRNYFLSIGYFVVRGCKFKYNHIDVTDIDLWIYGKSSAIYRERINVDIKNKKTPQAMERIFWAKGLQTALGLDAAIVATTDTRADVNSFGLEHDVTVLNGSFISKLIKSERIVQERITEEDFLRLIDKDSIGKLGGDWVGKYENSKSRVITSLNFDGCNYWLNDVGYFIEQAIQAQSQSESVWRMVYISLAFFLIGIDFVLSKHSVADHDQKVQLLENGFRYGSLGKGYADKIAKLASELAISAIPNQHIGQEIKRSLSDQADLIKADVLSEFFSKGNISSQLFEMAREFEFLAFSKATYAPNAISANAKSAIAVICDYYNFDRKKVLS